MSTRGDILDNLGTQLLTITTTNGYSQDIGSVYREVHHPEESNATGMDITIIDEPSDAPEQYADAGIVRMSMTVSLLVDVWGAQRKEPTDGTHPVADAIDNAVGDIRKLVHAPISLGSNVLFVELGVMEPGSVGERHTRFTVPLVINYKYDAASP